MNKKYKKEWNRWEKSSYPKRMELLNMINSNSFKKIKRSLFYMTKSIAEFSTIKVWVNDFIQQGYVNVLDKTERQYEYELTNKGKVYFNDYIKDKLKGNTWWEQNGN